MLKSSSTEKAIMFVPVELAQELQEIKQQQQQILQHLQTLNAKESEDKLLSIAETCALFQPKISRPTLYKYEEQGLLQRQMMGSKIVFSRNAVLSAARSIKRYKKGGN
jgi:hypothetical protein